MSGLYRLVRIEPDGTSSTDHYTYSLDEVSLALVDAYNQLPAESRVEFTTEPELPNAWAYAVPVQHNH